MGGLESGPREYMAKGLIGSSFADGLDTAAKRKALDAEIDALSKGNTGAGTEWTSGKTAKGIVTPGQPFEVFDRTCRRYKHQLFLGSTQRTAEATACRNDDGIWQPLN